MNRFLCLLIVVSACCLPAIANDRPRINDAQIEYFERKIRPILSARCYGCHSAEAETLHAGLRLDSATHLQIGGDSGVVVVPGEPESSLLLATLHYDGDIQMPPEGKLPDDEIAELTAWIERGAPFPSSVDPAERPSGGVDYAAGRGFWAFQPVVPQPLPAIADADWPRGRIDAFILAAMEQQGLRPAPEADRSTLIRRLSFALTGLPPDPEQVRKFLTDDSPRAYERLVDRFLQSPQYGETWARMWLDKARYTDRTASWLEQHGQPHLYRDWVVQAFQHDLRYDDFVHRQLATDLMPETGPEDLPALGFLGLSPSYWKELKLPAEIIKVIVADEWEERVDAVSRTFLGLTVACARCHDHKFDPISSEDYYALAGVLASCRLKARPLVADDQYEPVRAAKAEIERLQAEIKTLEKAKPTEQLRDPQSRRKELQARIEELEATTPLFDTPLASAVTDESVHVVRAGKRPDEGTRLEYRDQPVDLPVFIRGDPNRPGPIVRRRFLEVLTDQPKPFEVGSGRLELARAITTDAEGLAARVIVNRIWLVHFGQGIVDTPSNFGATGARPSHPALLDDLAARFIANGWSMKWLHREILTSAAWRQSSTHDPQLAEVDPPNRWLSRMNRRRLTFEAWRDAILVASGQLSLAVGGPSQDLADPENRRRTIYATIHRRDMSTTLQIHDFPDPTAHSSQRLTTTTALQGLYALNSRFLQDQAAALVHRVDDEGAEGDQGRIEHAYWLLYGRPPSPREQQLALDFLGETVGESRRAAWNQYAHALLASNEFLFLD